MDTDGMFSYLSGLKVVDVHLNRLVRCFNLGGLLMLVEMVVYGHLRMVDDLEGPQGILRRSRAVFVLGEDRAWAMVGVD